MHIVIKGSANNLSDKSNDELHQRRKDLEDKMRVGILSKDKMEMRDCKDEDEENRRVAEYDRWKDKNQGNMQEWHQINREFKSRGEEGRVHSLDDLRSSKTVRYD